MNEQLTSHRAASSLRKVHAALCVLSGLMLGFSFPPSSLGILACFALIPLLIVLTDTFRTGVALRYTYLAIVLFHIITLNWTGGYEHGNDPYMMIAGAVTMLIHPFFYFIPIGLFLFIRNRLGETAGLVSFPFLWVGYEYSHSLSEWSFPWLTIGNSHSYDLARIQFISATGVYGMSLLVVTMNVVGFVLLSNILRGKWRLTSLQTASTALVLILLYMVPKFHGEALLRDAPDYGAGGIAHGQQEIVVGIIQSNIDPWEKWESNAGDVTGLYLSLTDSLIRSRTPRPDLILWPETALPYRILSVSGRDQLGRVLRAMESWQTSIVTGFPHVVVYEDSSEAPPSAKTNRFTRERYDNYNAAAFLPAEGERIGWYGKMKMVPLAERVPYADLFYFFDFLRWGVGIGGWQIGPDSTVFVEPLTKTPFSVNICYESTYPEFVSTFVKKGAEFISIITIDSWWGRMSGAFQHRQFAVFRAIENRRWIARCAVGGFSGFIDPYGRMYDQTELFEQKMISRSIGRSEEITYYAENGDWLSRGCTLAGGLFFAAAVGEQFRKRMRRIQ